MSSSDIQCRPSIRQRRLQQGTVNAWDAPVEVVENEQKVTTVELFSDLVFVVAIHMVSTPLEESTSVFTDGTLPLFLLRVYLLWHAWHSGVLYTNIANLFTEGTDQLRAIHYVVVFACMMCTAFIAQSCNLKDDRSILYYFCGQRVIIAVAWVCEASRPRPSDMDEVHYKNIWDLGVKLAIVATFEVILLIAAALKCDLVSGTASKTSLTIWCVTAVLLFFVRTRVSCHPDQMRTIDEASFQERYELITLILIGELVFAAAMPGSVILSMCAVLIAACCFLLLFTKVKKRIEAWALTPFHVLQAGHAHFGLFCSLPCLGAALSQAIRHSGSETEAENASEGERSLSMFLIKGWRCSSPTLLIVSVGSVMVYSAIIMGLCKDPQGADEPRNSLQVRVSVCIIGGLSVFGLLPLHLCAWHVVGILTVLMACVVGYELWASQPVQEVKHGGGYGRLDTLEKDLTSLSS